MINLKKLIYEAYTDTMLSEGGASGHMTHLFEDPDLTFK